MIISLAGFMGCGKSSVGKILSSLLSCNFTDLDFVVEETRGISIPEIFKSDGECGFRKTESECLHNYIRENKDKKSVLALGGGTLTTPENAVTVKEKTTCIYLKASIETLSTNIENSHEERPLLHDITTRTCLHDTISMLMQQRAEVYMDTAHVVIETDGKSIEEIAKEIVTYLDSDYNGSCVNHADDKT